MAGSGGLSRRAGPETAAGSGTRRYDAGRGMAGGGSWAVPVATAQRRLETGKSAAVADRMPNLPRECRKAMWRKPMKGVFIRRLLMPPPAGGVVAGQGLARARRGGGRKRYRKAKSGS